MEISSAVALYRFFRGFQVFHPPAAKMKDRKHEKFCSFRWLANRTGVLWTGCLFTRQASFWLMAMQEATLPIQQSQLRSGLILIGGAPAVPEMPEA